MQGSAQLTAKTIPDSNAPNDLYEFFLNKIEEFKSAYLYPTKTGVRFAFAATQWLQLEKDIQIAAERIWRDAFLRDASNQAARTRLRHTRQRVAKQHHAIRNPERQRFEMLIRYSHLFLLLWLEINFYRLRMTSNFQIHQVVGGAQATSDSRLHEVNEAIKDYSKRVADWHDQIRHILKISSFRTSFGNAQRLRAMSKAFDIGGTKLPEELGWSKDASDVGDRLRFEYFNSLLKERRKSPRTWLGALWLTVFKWTTGFGMRPLRFIGTTVGVVTAFTGLYYFSDLNGELGCYPQNPYPVAFNLKDVLTHLYIAVTNLTSLGSNPPPCGPGARILMASESLIGYFLLATMATLILQQVIDPER